MKKRSYSPNLRCPSEGLYLIVLQRIWSCKKENENLIKFPVLFSKLCTSLQITKQQAWEILYLFNDLGFIKIICGHGVKINHLNHIYG